MFYQTTKNWRSCSCCLVESSLWFSSTSFCLKRGKILSPEGWRISSKTSSFSIHVGSPDRSDAALSSVWTRHKIMLLSDVHLKTPKCSAKHIFSVSLIDSNTQTKLVSQAVSIFSDLSRTFLFRAPYKYRKCDNHNISIANNDVWKSFIFINNALDFWIVLKGTIGVQNQRLCEIRMTYLLLLIIKEDSRLGNNAFVQIEFGNNKSRVQKLLITISLNFLFLQCKFSMNKLFKVSCRRRWIFPSYMDGYNLQICKVVSPYWFWTIQSSDSNKKL